VVVSVVVASHCALVCCQVKAPLHEPLHGSWSQPRDMERLVWLPKLGRDGVKLRYFWSTDHKNHHGPWCP
ncbi:hypothetical protein MTR67_017773, partial [Solanum verrucosum]